MALIIQPSDIYRWIESPCCGTGASLKSATSGFAKSRVLDVVGRLASGGRPIFLGERMWFYGAFWWTDVDGSGRMWTIDRSR